MEKEKLKKNTKNLQNLIKNRKSKVAVFEHNPYKNLKKSGSNTSCDSYCFYNE